MKVFLVILPLLATAAVPAIAESDHDRARRAVLSGEVVPLRTILDRATAEYGGEFIEAELEDEGEQMVYKVKLITPAGKVVKLVYDARDGSLLSARERGRR